MDHADAADAAIELQRAAAERSARGKSGVEEHPDFDGSCMDCGGDIPPARLALGRIRCIGCQARIETNRAMGRK